METPTQVDGGFRQGRSGCRKCQSKKASLLQHSFNWTVNLTCAPNENKCMKGGNSVRLPSECEQTEGE